LNGWDSTQYIRLKFKAPKKDIPIIALTAYASESDRKKCFDSGMNDVVTKPFNAEELYVKINNLLFSQDKLADVVKRSKPKKEESLLADLEEKYEGNKVALLEIYNLFLAELPVYLKELEALKTVGDLNGIKKQIHKMKSPLGLVANEELLNYFDQLHQADVLENEKQRDQLIERVIASTEKIIDEIEKKVNS